MKTKWYSCLFVLILTGMALAQAPVIDLPIIVTDGAGGVLELRLGLDPAATDTLDKLWGEKELPPFPPQGVFEARFVGEDIAMPKLGEGTVKDYRKGYADQDSVFTHELKYQVGLGTKIIIKWDLPKGITGLMQDLFGGVVVNKIMAHRDSLVVTNPGALNKLKMIVTYTGIPLAPILWAPPDNADSVAINPTLSWKSSPGATGYHVQVATDTSFAANIIEQSGIADTTCQIQQLQYHSRYFWRVRAGNVNGLSDWSPVRQFTTRVETAVSTSDIGIPFEFQLFQNYPNPFNPSTMIHYILPKAGCVRISVYDLLGKKILDLVNAEMPAGQHQVEFVNRDCPSGLYFYTMESGEFKTARKMSILK